MIPALRLVPPGHTLVTLGERLFGGLVLYYDRAPRGTPYFPRIQKRPFLDFIKLYSVVLMRNCRLSACLLNLHFRNLFEALVPKTPIMHAAHLLAITAAHSLQRTCTL